MCWSLLAFKAMVDDKAMAAFNLEWDCFTCMITHICGDNRFEVQARLTGGEHRYRDHNMENAVTTAL